MKEETDLLLARYFSGEASAEDQVRLEDWLSKSEGHQQYFDQLTRLYEQVAVPEQAPRKPAMEKALTTFLDYIKQAEYNASEAMPSEVSAPREASASKTANEKKQAGNGVFGVVRRRWPVIMAAASIVLLLTFTFVRYTLERGLVRLMSHQSALEHTLPDGTSVLLSMKSQLEYNKDYGKTNRTLRLRGEAFVKVGTAGKGKFLIETGETVIEDVGTSFRVIAWPSEDEIMVTVQEGSVFFYTKNNKGIRIEGGQSGSFRKSSHTFLTHAEAPAKAPAVHLVFNATPLREVANTLNEQYHARISVKKELENKTITVEFEGQELELVLEVIAQTLQLKVSRVGDTILLY